VPPVQLFSLTLILVMEPIRSLATLGMVLEWKDPSSVTWHLTVTSELWNSSLDQVTLKVVLSMLRFLANAVLTALASKMAAMSAVRPSLMVLRINCLSCELRLVEPERKKVCRALVAWRVRHGARDRTRSWPVSVRWCRPPFPELRHGRDGRSKPSQGSARPRRIPSAVRLAHQK